MFGGRIYKKRGYATLQVVFSAKVFPQEGCLTYKKRENICCGLA
jgi:hypothetical protein